MALACSTEVEEKRCTKCGQVKRLEEFSPNRQGYLGRDSRCKECRLLAWNPERHRAAVVRRQEAARLLAMGQKRCAGCSEVKRLEEFYPEKRARDGRQSRCRACDRDRRQDPAYRERDRERDRERYASDPANRARRLQENRKSLRKPEVKDRRLNRQRRSDRERYANDPEFRERRRRRDQERVRDRENERRWRAEHGHPEQARGYCPACGLYFSTSSVYEWCHRSRQLATYCLDPASRGLVARKRKDGTVVWRWPAGGQVAAQREIRRLRRVAQRAGNGG